jgi:hypothetical protein
MCIVWIGSLSYVVAWMITIIGELPSLWNYEWYLTLVFVRDTESRNFTIAVA